MRAVEGQLPLFSTSEEHREEPRRPTRRRAKPVPAPLPPTLDVVAAADLLGIGRTVAYRLIREGRWPTHVVRVGRKIKVPTVPLLRFLGVDPGFDGVRLS